MIEKLIAYCAKNKFIIFVMIGAALIGGFWSIQNIRLDAIPDLSDTQVVIFSRWDRSPDIIEDQVTYPVVTAMLGAPRVKNIRGFSDFGFSYVYVIFEDGTDIYWARSRTLEYLSKILPGLPEGVKVELGPDATGVGWVFQYALVDGTGRHSLADLRSYQDWYLRYYLQSVPGVAEVATFGGFQKQYQITVDPNKLISFQIPINRVIEAVRAGNNETGGRLLEFAGAEYMVRGRGYAKSIEDIENIVVGTDERGTPILVKHVGSVRWGPEIRRGAGDFNGLGDTVGGIVVMRHGENALRVIERVKTKLKEVESSMPEGVELITTYDRSDLIRRAMETLRHELIAEMVVVSAVIFIFLLHFPSALVPILMLPTAVILSFIPFYALGLTSNVMSLGGIAISIGAMVDAAIVVVENAHKKLERWEQEGKKGDYHEILIQAIQEVGRASFFSLMVIAISFFPIFTLEAQEGRLFKPLAWTKNLSMAIAAVLAVTFVPAVMMFLIRYKRYRFKPSWLSGIVNRVLVGEIHSEEKHPVSRLLFRLYEPAVSKVLKYPKQVIVIAGLLVLASLPVYFKLGSEFMPALNEGAILYMPTTPPGISVTEATRLLHIQDKILKSFPEVETVHGKVGRADTSTDPAPFSMVETVIVLKPEREWRRTKRWYSLWAPPFFKEIFQHIWPERITFDELVNEMDQKMKFPGMTNAWTMPIKNRIDMLTTGVRTPLGIKVYGSDLKVIEEIGEKIEAVVRKVPGTRSVYAERVTGGYFVDFDIKREQLARYGLSVEEVQGVIMSAIGGENVSMTVEGRERYGINVRYPQNLRDDIDELKRVLVATPGAKQIPLAEVADVHVRYGPSMIRNEDGLLAGYVYVDMTGRDMGRYVRDAKEAVRREVKLPTGYSLSWSGQYEYMERVRGRLFVTIPLTIFLIFVLLYFNTRSLVKTGIVFLAVPFSLIGAIGLLYLLGYNMSIAVWVGMIALAGLDAETGVFMLLYLDLAYDERKKAGKLRTYEDLKAAIHHGAVQRIRPKMMTVTTTFIALLPIMWMQGTGADVMKRIAAPMVGGLFTSFLMELLVYPALYAVWKWHFEMKKGRALPETQGQSGSAL